MEKGDKKAMERGGRSHYGAGQLEKSSMYKGKKGFGIGARTREDQRIRRPGNTSVGTLLADERCIPAVLSFLANTRCGQVKEGIIMRGGGP